VNVLDGIPFEVDLVAQIDHVTGECLDLRVVLEDPRVALVFDHVGPSS
jgi:hypothetical protein